MTNITGECFINGDKNNPYTGYINPLCSTNGVLVSSDEKTIYGFIRYAPDPCDLTIFDAINNSSIPIKDMLLGDDEDYDIDPRINFIFLQTPTLGYNSYLRDQKRFGPTQTCANIDFRCS